MKLKTALFAAAATLAMAPAAQAYQGLYGAIGAGLSYMSDDRDVEALFGPVWFDSDADYKNGIGVYTSLGYSYESNWRTELEYSYRDHDIRHWVSDAPVFSGFQDGLDGGISAHSLMANLIKDFGDGAITPYAGVGVGMARLKQNLTGVHPAPIGGFSPMLVSDSSLTFAYQGIAGLAFRLAEGLSLDVSYRYFATLQPEFEGTLAGVPFTYKTDYRTHNVFAGLRWNFGGPSAPPPVQYKDCWDGSSVPVTAQCPPQLVEDTDVAPDPIGVTVYFDFDKSNLTPEAAQLVREAASRAIAYDIDTVRVEGHTDTVGSAAYNQALSQRRASVVRDALVSNGVPADRIVVEAFGKTRPAKPTPDGVREPLNRRTEVTISFE